MAERHAVNFVRRAIPWYATGTPFQLPCFFTDRGPILLVLVVSNHGDSRLQQARQGGARIKLTRCSMKIISAECACTGVPRTIVAVALSLMLPAAGGAQTPEQQVVNDAAQALGGRDRIAAVKTMLLEGAGNQVSGTSLRYDDLGYASAINQLRDVKRAYDLGERPRPVRRDQHGGVRVLHRQLSQSSDARARRNDCLQPDAEWQCHPPLRQPGECQAH